MSMLMTNGQRGHNSLMTNIHRGHKSLGRHQPIHHSTGHNTTEQNIKWSQESLCTPKEYIFIYMYICILYFVFHIKIDGVGLFDNRPSVD